MDNGAHYYRCDFQVHTPRDCNWKGQEFITEEERMAYATRLIESCREKDLNAIAITDHHDMAFIRYVQQAAEEETDGEGNFLPLEHRIVVFPGMELTLAVPCQAILILDADFERNRFDAVMTTFAINPADESESKTAQTERLENIQSLKNLKEKLDEQKWLRDRYIIFPNVTGEGKFSLLRRGMAAKYKEMPFVGGYLDGDMSRLKSGQLNILRGKDVNWGYKRTAVIQTSDNRRDDHEDLGKYSSWIKWAKPTAEALRQACLAQESRITHDFPKLPTITITNISVSNSKFMGPVELSFNPQYNAIIGGRGTGKSTILEYLRWALCDQPPNLSDGVVPNYELRRNRLIENTLKPFAATVDVTFSVNNVPHVVRRNSKDGTLQIKIGADEMRECVDEEVRALLPIQAYSQKQLSDVSIRINELTRLISTPINSELAQVNRQIDEQANKVRETYTTLRRFRGVSNEFEKRKLQIRSLDEQADSIRKSLTGLSEADRKLLDQGKHYDAAVQLVESWLNKIRLLATESTALVQKIDDKFFDSSDSIPPELPHRDVLQSISLQYANFMSDAKDALNTIKSQAAEIIEQSSGDESTAWQEWQVSLSKFRTSYQAAVQRSSARKEQMEELNDIESLLVSHQQEKTRLETDLKSLEESGNRYTAAREAWQRVKSERDELLANQCKSLTLDSDETIRAQVHRYRIANEFIIKLKEVLRGSSIRQDKLEKLGEAITSAKNPEKKWVAILEDLELLAAFDSKQEGVERRPNSLRHLTVMTTGDLDRISRWLTSDNWLSLSLVEIKSEPEFEYRISENEYISFSNASAGQQATALLRTLLNKAGPPLFIDQPEDDLDNPVVQEIVEKIWQTKQTRQIIFVSHNANLVVNGDAELVAWCDYRNIGDQSGGKIVGEGAIDVPEVRNAIKRIMEGGDKAFNLRRSKYGF